VQPRFAEYCLQYESCGGLRDSNHFGSFTNLSTLVQEGSQPAFDWRQSEQIPQHGFA
jgi:hypothetical protein